MNTEDTHNRPADSDGCAIPPPDDPHSATGALHSEGRANGKVARLPKSIRDQINNLLLDGLSYPAIIKRLGDHGKNLKPDNLSQWKKRGHQDWLAEQAFIARTRSRQETPSDLTRDFDATDVGHAALQLGTLHVFEALRDLSSPRPSDGRGARGEGASGDDQSDQKRTSESDSSPSPPPSRAEASWRRAEESAGLPSKALAAEGERRPFPGRASQLDLLLGGDSMAFARLLNALARASRETMLLQKYREACHRARQALQQLRDPNRKVSESETRAIVRVVDSILGLNSPDSDDDRGPTPGGMDDLPHVPNPPASPNEPENTNGEHSLTQ